MMTLGNLGNFKRCTTSTGTVTFSFPDLNFTSGQDYEVLILCGQAYAICNSEFASPPITTNKTATTCDVQVTTAPACILLVPYVMKGKSVLP